MKTLKIIGALFGSLLLCAGIGVFSLNRSMANIVTDSFTDVIVDQIFEQSSSTQLINQLPADIQDKLPADATEKLDAVKEAISSDAHLNELSKTYMDALLDGALNGSANLPDVNSDVHDLITDYTPKVMEAAGVEVTNEQVEELAKQVNERVDLQEVLNQTVQKVNTSLSPSQKQMLSTIQSIQSDNFKFLSYGLMIGGIIIIIIATLSAYRWLIYAGVSASLSGVVLMIASKIGAIFINEKLSTLGDAFSNVGDGITSSLFQSGLWAFGIGIVGIIAYVIIYFILEHVSYE